MALLDIADDLERALWADACLAADVFALLVQDEAFEKAGLLVKAHAGPVRDLWMAYLQSRLPERMDMHTVPSNISVERLLGGLDLGLTLAQGKAVEMRGVLAQADQGLAFLPMAGLLEPQITSLITAAMDTGCVRVERDGLSKVIPARFAMLCFDESDGEAEGVNADLLDRVMLHVDLRAVSLRTAQQAPSLPAAAGPQPDLSADKMRQLCELPPAFGLMSMRPALQMVHLAKTLCRLSGDTQVGEDHINAAIRLGLVHRARQLPAPPRDAEQDEPQLEDPPPDPPQNEQDPNDRQREDDPREEGKAQSGVPDDMALEATTAKLPAGLLAYLKAGQVGQTKRASMGRRGARKTGGKRGRPLASRKGALSAGKRLDLIATLRAAAPFQKARAAQAAAAHHMVQNANRRVHVRMGDFHIRRYQERSETSTIFVVDASGSTALNRLREAKGAVELLLGESYARRDYVSLVSFRGREAQVLLPPTRALVRAKRSLASLPGGGGTPLASGIQAALTLAQEERKKGRDPAVVIMTDGSANVDASGQGGRKQAGEDAQAMARNLAFTGISAILVDIGRQPQAKARDLADVMNALYLPMPFAGSKELSAIVGASR